MPSELDENRSSVFNSIAFRYELVNTVISGGLYRHWNKKLLTTILESTTPQKMLDLCCGTGIVIRTLINEMQRRNLTLPSIDGVDFSEEMLQHSRNAFPSNIRLIKADALHLPMDDGSYDTISIAYGIRNLSPQKEAVRELIRVLEPHGTIHILELFQPNSLALSFLHKLYLMSVVPLVGGCLTGVIQPYVYLAKSLHNYSLAGLVQTIKTCGGKCERVHPLFCGAAALITVRK
jgi:demethylmenaquinone methyltransferase / 2-methoxy-6-polyprenyl-1,4-benzoquinol methylase